MHSGDGVSYESYKNSDEKLEEVIRKKQFKSAIDQMARELSEYSAPYLIYLHAEGHLEKILQTINKENPNKLENLPELYYVIKKIYDNFFEKVGIKEGQQMKKILSNPNYKSLFEAKKGQQMNLKQSKHSTELVNLVEALCSNPKHTELNDLRRRVLRIKVDDDTYLEVSVNWMRKELDSILKNNHMICCKSFFEKDESIGAIEGKNQQFKRYVWPINATNIKTHIKKTIVGFLNMYGGIIYIGIYEDKNKKNSVSGIILEKTKLKEVFQFFKQLVKQIHPQHPSFKVSEEQVVNYEGERLQINKFIHLEFLTVADKQSYLNFRTNSDLEKLYLVKVVVKIGYPKHLYHLINNEQMIDFYVREDRNVEKKPFPEAHSMIYQRLDKFYGELQCNGLNYNFDRKLFHDYCQYDMIKFDLEDEDREEIDSDSD